MEWIIFLCVFLGIWLKVNNNDMGTYRRSLVINLAGFLATALAALILNFNRTIEIGLGACETGFGSAIIFLIIFRGYRSYKGEGSSWGCLWPIVIYFQFGIAFIFSTFLLIGASDAGTGGQLFSVITFLGLMASLALFHAWAGPVLAGFNLGTGIVGLIDGNGSLFFWTNIFDMINLGPFAQWVWLIISTLMSVSIYWERIFNQETLNELSEKLPWN